MHVENARIPGTTGRSTLPKKPFEGRRQLCTVVEVRFDQVLHSHPFDCGDLLVRPGDMLVVMTEKGPQIAKAVSVPERRLLEADRVRRVVRRAHEHDLRNARELADEARRAMKYALGRVREHNLPMKLVVVEYMLDRSRALVYFTSESRVDFRNLVRELANELRIRIEMRQIGVRDGTGVIGGIGPCGHELCCSSFLRDFQTVSIREPKEQGITLNPQRITGMCGRLKCCLLYEKPSYAAMRPFAPKADRSVMTSQGPASIIEVDALSRKLQVRFPGGAVESIHMRELIVLDVRLTQEELQATMSREEEVLARRRQKTAGGRVGTQSASAISQDDYLWADVEQKISFFDTEDDANESSATTEERRSRRRRRGGRTSDAVSERGTREAGSGAASTDGSSSDNAKGAKQRPVVRRDRSAGPSQSNASGRPIDAEGTVPPNEGEGSASRRRRRRRKPESSSAASPASGANAEGRRTAADRMSADRMSDERASTERPDAEGSSSSSSRRRRRRSRGGGGGNGGGTPDGGGEG